MIISSATAFAGDIFNRSKETKSMKNLSWNTAKPEEEKADKENTTVKEEKEEDKEKLAKKEEEELTPEQKLWKKYRDLAYGTGNNDDIDKAKENITEEEANEEKTGEKTEDKENAASVGIAAIIEEYKKSQENKGKMNSRSFGKID